MDRRDTFTADEIKAFAPAEKIGLIASINPDGLVHLTLITSIMASDPKQLTIGQFCVGLSKWYMQLNPKVAFLIMSMDKRLWRGKARWTHKQNSGPEYEAYNEMPMFRYNAYFGINTVHYLDLMETTGEQKLPMGKIIPAAIMTRLTKGAAKTGSARRILKPFAENLFNGLNSLKFISYIGGDGFPVIIPAIQCQAADSRRLVFTTQPYNEELEKIASGTSMAVFGMNLKMQSVLVRGSFLGFKNYRWTRMGVLDIDWVYNSMPPGHGQIYPETKLEPIVEF